MPFKPITELAVHFTSPQRHQLWAPQKLPLENGGGWESARGRGRSFQTEDTVCTKAWKLQVSGTLSPLVLLEDTGQESSSHKSWFIKPGLSPIGWDFSLLILRGWIILCRGYCAVHCCILSSIPGPPSRKYSSGPLLPKKWRCGGDCPGDPVVRTLSCNAGGAVRPLVRELRYHMPHGQKPKT